MSERKIQPVVRKYRLGEEPKELLYWKTQSGESRILALEEIRREHHGWTDETEPRLQRVYRVFKRE